MMHHILVSIIKILAIFLLIGPQSLSAEVPATEKFKRVGLSIGLRKTSKNRVQFTLDGVTFRIPINQLYTILENNQHASGEIRGGFTMVGLWPGFEPKTRENISLFTGVPTERDAVSFSLDRYCKASSNPESALQDRCSLAAGMDKLYKAYGIQHTLVDRFYPAGTGVYSPVRIPSVARMAYQGYIINHPNSSKVYAKDLLYRGTVENGKTIFSVCARQANRDHYNCTIWLPWRDRFYVTIRLREAFLPEWQAIHATALERLESYIVTDETPFPPADILWAPFP